MIQNNKPKVYITTPVFREIADNEKISESKRNAILDLWAKLREDCDLRFSSERFPNEQEIKNEIKNFRANVVGCHLSHPIKKEFIENSDVFAVCTSTAGYNHIELVPGVIITHTPGVLHRTVADFTIAVILSNLRNIVKLHNFVWEGSWKPGQKWDLDENLSNTVDNKVLGIIGMGEIGRELTRRLYPWGVTIKYYDIKQQPEFEEKFPGITYVDNMEEIFSTCDIVSLHLPLMTATRHIINEKYLKLMKKNALLVNTARGPVLDANDLMDLLEKEEIEIDLAFDVYEDEPIHAEDLNRYRKIMEQHPNRRFVFIPHNASADADTRAEMAIMILEDIYKLATSKTIEDIDSIRFIPEQRYLIGGKDKKPDIEKYKIIKFWEK